MECFYHGLSWLFWAYKAKDPKATEGPPSLCLVRDCLVPAYWNSMSNLSSHTRHFILWETMWSCEYVKVPAAENGKRRTILETKWSNYSSHSSPNFELDGFVFNTFEKHLWDAKEGYEWEIRRQNITCPVRTWAWMGINHYMNQILPRLWWLYSSLCCLVQDQQIHSLQQLCIEKGDFDC